MGAIRAAIADGSFLGGTNDDHFFGAIHPAGISSIKIRNIGGGGIEVDHLQYGMVEYLGQCIRPPEDMVSWWPGDDLAHDIAGAHHGELAGDATFGIGRVSRAFLLDGDGDEVVVAHDAWLNLQTLTIDAWVFPTLLDGAVEMIVNMADTTSAMNRCI